jgi:hypothetical protein
MPRRPRSPGGPAAAARAGRAAPCRGRLVPREATHLPRRRRLPRRGAAVEGSSPGRRHTFHADADADAGSRDAVRRWRVRHPRGDTASTRASVPAMWCGGGGFVIQVTTQLPRRRRLPRRGVAVEGSSRGWRHTFRADAGSRGAVWPWRVRRAGGDTPSTLASVRAARCGRGGFVAREVTRVSRWLPAPGGGAPWRGGAGEATWIHARVGRAGAGLASTRLAPVSPGGAG